MNININHYLKYIRPLLTVVFIAYFLSTLLFFILPKKGIDHLIITPNSMTKQTQSNKTNSTGTTLHNRLLLKAIYKKDTSSWIVLENKRSGKIIYLKEGDTMDGFTLSKVNKNNVVITTNEEKFTLNLNIKRTKLEDIIHKENDK